MVQGYCKRIDYQFDVNYIFKIFHKVYCTKIILREITRVFSHQAASPPWCKDIVQEQIINYIFKIFHKVYCTRIILRESEQIFSHSAASPPWCKDIVKEQIINSMAIIFLRDFKRFVVQQSFREKVKRYSLIRRRRILYKNRLSIRCQLYF